MENNPTGPQTALQAESGGSNEMMTTGAAPAERERLPDPSGAPAAEPGTGERAGKPTINPGTAPADTKPTGTDTAAAKPAGDSDQAPAPNPEGGAEETDEKKDRPGAEPPEPNEEDQGEALLRAHVDELVRQEQALKEKLPGFSLRQALQEERFVRLTGPGTGISVEDAWYALHHAELTAAAVRAAVESAEEKLANAVQANAGRPAEGGTPGGTRAPLIPDYRSMTPAQRESLREAIRSAAARGEKLYPEFSV